MRNLILLFCWMIFIENAHTQTKIVDFSSAITSTPLEKKTLVMDVVYNNGEFNTVKKRFVKSKKTSKDIKSEYSLMGKIIDSLGLIDYKTDTIYILSTYYFNSLVSEIFKTSKDTFNIIKNIQGEYSIQALEDYYINISEDEKNSDFVLYETIFSWNIDLLIRLIKSSGEPLGSEYFMSATRIILKDNQVLKKDIINFEPTLHWKLE